MNAVALDTRTCECGCARSFRCLPTSSQKYASSACADPSGTLRVWGRGRKTDPVKLEARKALGIPDAKDEEPAGNLLTTAMLAERLGKSTMTISAWVKRGKITAKHPGKGRRASLFCLEDVQAALADARPLPPIEEEVPESGTSADEDFPKPALVTQPSAAVTATKPKRAIVYLREAKRCREQKLHQAERVLLWLAVEALGLMNDDQADSSLHSLKLETMKATLEKHGGNRTQAAKELGVCVRTMRGAIKRYDLEASQ
jgi:DNA-binding protein Fis